MALPVAPPPTPTDVAVLDWAGVSVRIAWTLLRLGVRVRDGVLSEVRRHVLYHLEPTMVATTAEDLAEHLTEEFVARARGERPDDPWTQDWDMPLSQRWRRAVEEALDDLADVVFRKHFGDHRPLGTLADILAVDPIALNGVRAGLREVVRRLAVSDGLPVKTWPNDRIDRLLSRLAAWAPGPCPRPIDVIEGFDREHVRACPRCNRLARLVQSSILTEAQLTPPSLGARPRATTRLLVLQVHADGHAHRRLLVDELPIAAFPLGDELLLVDATDLPAISAALVTATEVGAPRAEHIRGAIIEGPGAWGEHGLGGPLPERAVREILDRAWGSVDELGPLPDELPPAPSARLAWAGVFLLLLAVVAVILVAAQRPAEETPSLVDVAFTSARQGTWAAFDVPDTTWVTVVSLADGALVEVLASRGAADKIAFAIGDGSYRLHAAGQGLAVMGHEHPLADLGDRLTQAELAVDPLGALAASYEGVVEVHIHRRE